MKSVPTDKLFFKPMKEEPPEGTTSIATLIDREGIRYIAMDGDPKDADTWGCLGEFFTAPFRPGEKCYVREAWCKSIIEGIIYKDGYDVPDAPRWRSPVTMPQWAARRFVTILSCEPIRVEEVTEEDAIKMGAYWWHPVDDFIEHWRKRHPGKEWAWRVVSEEEE